MSSTLKIQSILYVLLLALLIGHVHACTYTARQIFQFPNTTFTDIENVGIRPNGILLLSIITSPTIYLLDPSESAPTAQLLHTFPNATSCLGVTETSPDIFAVVVGNISVATKTGVPGTFAIWSVNLRLYPPVISKIAAVPEAKILNGLTHLQSDPVILLAADSQAGAIFSLNITSGVSEITIQNAALLPSATFPLGINGLHPFGKDLYFTNSALGTFGSIPIDSMGKATGNVSIIATDGKGDAYDDFAIDRHGNFWVTNHPDILAEITLGGEQMTIVNATSLVQPTSAIFGKGHSVLYVVTGGSQSNTTIQSGQVFEIKID